MIFLCLLLSMPYDVILVPYIVDGWFGGLCAGVRNECPVSNSQCSNIQHASLHAGVFNAQMSSSPYWIAGVSNIFFDTAVVAFFVLLFSPIFSIRLPILIPMFNISHFNDFLVYPIYMVQLSHWFAAVPHVQSDTRYVCDMQPSTCIFWCIKCLRTAVVYAP